MPISAAAALAIRLPSSRDIFQSSKVIRFDG
jgi:hypothetical protein